MTILKSLQPYHMVKWWYFKIGAYSNAIQNVYPLQLYC